MMKYRVTVAKRSADANSGFGKSGQPKYEILGTFWMGETFNKGVKAMREGALDAYDTVMFRCRFIKQLDRWCLLNFKGKWYQITSFNDDYQTPFRDCQWCSVRYDSSIARVLYC